jgi:high-affinity nickel permease
MLAESAAAQTFGVGLVVAAFWFGFRHGIDWDHIAAITDITSSQENRRESIEYGTLYALGHAVVVFAIGVIAILVGKRLPESVDNLMTRIVGATLVLLAVYVFVSLIRHGRDFRLRSRWMLIFSGVRRGTRWARDKVGGGPGDLDESAAMELADEELAVGQDPTDPSLWHHGHHGRPGHHHHVRSEKDEDQFMTYGRWTAFSVGMLHGIGGETPTQVILFAGLSAGSGGVEGVIVLMAFLVGLFGSNTLITLGSAFGFLRASKNWGVYLTVSIITGVFSLILGIIFLTGSTSVLPAIFGG